ncbi:MAG: ATP synthase F1 subunit gamma [Prevotellaceae bacterium]|jgi:F-type H+-transporting ATPase subunit gamma|nr:ATP synthase F1 subunit gamma [Prevotellaceae bacterium]
MASLKEVKTRIASVQSTRKITEARQMIASAQLHRAQIALKHAQYYHQALQASLGGMIDADSEYHTPLTEARDAGAVAIVILSSNSGMNGSFNAKMEKELHTFEKLYPDETLMLIPAGNKVRKALLQLGKEPACHFDHLVNKPSFEDIAQMAATLIDLYTAKKVKKIELVSYHFKSIGAQNIQYKTFLPYRFPANSATNNTSPNYILEPSLQVILEKSLPLLLHAMLYTTFIDHQTSEFAARTVAMQLASENANELLDELRLTYNKVRQQNITAELLDIMGSSFA